MFCIFMFCFNLNYRSKQLSIVDFGSRTRVMCLFLMNFGSMNFVNCDFDLKFSRIRYNESVELGITTLVELVEFSITISVKKN
ncbi:unnamed protein product [Brassica napus]|uniref:(rape) hypothetical protein n=1 Tax=Brassica napus TaxID=3708 RepID=A0A816IGE6_BRANA|nr:unnamed protein product [Brassica napus]